MTQPLGALSAAMIDHALKPRPKKDTARTLILRKLKGRLPMAVHELKIEGCSENALSTRLPEMAREGLTQGRYRPGKPFKEWFLTPDGERAA